MSGGSNGPLLRFWIQDVKVGYPIKEDDSMETRLLPHECRERGISYFHCFLSTVATRRR